MALKEQIEQDLKAALLNRDQLKISTLRGLKSAILYAEVAKNSREAGLSEEEVTRILSKESKKRQESADLYKQGGDENRAKTELEEKAIIDSYLPKQLSESELQAIVDEVVKSSNATDIKSLGEVIGKVKQRVGASADGSTIARLVRAKLSGEA